MKLSPRGDAETDVLVVGAGIIGSAVAFRLAEGGHHVTVVDGGGQAGHGSTSASSAIVRFHYRSLDSAAMAWDSHAAWNDWREEVKGVDPAGMPHLRTTGVLMLGDAALFGEVAVNLERLGIAAEVLDPYDIGQRWPALDASVFGPPARPDDPLFWAAPGAERLGGLFTPDGGYVADPQRAAGTYAWAAQRHGATFRFNATVTALDLRDDHRWRATVAGDEAMVARVVVNAAGPLSYELNTMAGLQEGDCMLSRPMATETHSVPAPAGFCGSAAVVLMDLDLGIAIRPEGSAHLHVSSLDPACDPLRWVDDARTVSGSPSLEAYEIQTLRAGRRLPDLAIPPRPRGLTALYDVSPDWEPLIGRTPLPGFYMVCGTSGNSFKTAPAIGRLAADDIDRMLAGLPTAEALVLPHISYVLDPVVYSPGRLPRPSAGVLA